MAQTIQKVHGTSSLCKSLLAYQERGESLHFNSESFAFGCLGNWIGGLDKQG